MEHLIQKDFHTIQLLHPIKFRSMNGGGGWEAKPPIDHFSQHNTSTPINLTQIAYGCVFLLYYIFC